MELAIFDDITCASLPPEALPLLAPLRCEPGLQIATVAGRLWLRFEPGCERILHGVLPLHGVELFAYRDGQWRRFNQSLPAFDVPADAGFRPLYQVLFPAPVLPLAPSDTSIVSCPLTLQPDDRPRPTTAMLCPVAALAAWADLMPAARIERLHGALHGRQIRAATARERHSPALPGGRGSEKIRAATARERQSPALPGGRGSEKILVLGDALPILEGGERFWGKLVLVPLGFCPDPDLPESSLREAAGAAADELLVIHRDNIETVPRTAFGQLSRAALRLALQEVT